MSSAAPLEYQGPLGNDPPPPEGSRRAMFILWLIVFADMLGFGVIIPSLPYYATKFNASPVQVALLFSLYSLFQFVASPILGMASDHYGRRPVLALSQIGTVSGYLLLGWVLLYDWQNAAVALWMVYLSRIIDGISGGNISTAHAYIGDISTPQNRAARMGLMGAAFGIGFSAGPAIGGLLSFIHPAAPAFGAAACCAVAAGMTFAFLPESRRRGSAASGDAESWLHPSRFVPLLRTPVVGQLLLIGFFSMMAFVMLEVIFALFLKDVFNYSQTTANWFFALVGVVIVIVQGGLIGRLTKIFGEWRLTIAGAFIAALSQAAYAGAGMKPVLALLLLAAVLNAVGRSIQIPTLNSLLSHTASPSTQGLTFGAYHGLLSLSRVIGPLIAGWLYARHHTGPFVVAGLMLAAVGVWMVAVCAKARETAAAGTPSGALDEAARPDPRPDPRPVEAVG
jgi:MFS transporter, DHA1 family, tetracycline resistance protein